MRRIYAKLASTLERRHSELWRQATRLEVLDNEAEMCRNRIDYSFQLSKMKIFTHSRIRLPFHALNKCSSDMQRNSSDKTYYYMEINELNK